VAGSVAREYTGADLTGGRPRPTITTLMAESWLPFDAAEYERRQALLRARMRAFGATIADVCA